MVASPVDIFRASAYYLDMADLTCAWCGDPTDQDPCEHCGLDPAAEERTCPACEGRGIVNVAHELHADTGEPCSNPDCYEGKVDAPFIVERDVELERLGDKVVNGCVLRPRLVWWLRELAASGPKQPPFAPRSLFDELLWAGLTQELRADIVTAFGSPREEITDLGRQVLAELDQQEGA